MLRRGAQVVLNLPPAHPRRMLLPGTTPAPTAEQQAELEVTVVLLIRRYNVQRHSTLRVQVLTQVQVLVGNSLGISLLLCFSCQLALKRLLQSSGHMS